ncbi:aldose epimerase family protein [Azohydromonas caseinilytica]|nr:D-hexose-6-phosphate mutarotase [Azohydromonas caseinilytica]
MTLLTHRPLGAQVLQADLSGTPVFYCSPLASQFMGPARGGVPVLFPQFADVGPLVKHGFARNMDWTLLEHGADAGQERLHYVLEIAKGDVSVWPHAVRLELEVWAQGQRVDFRFTVLNTGDSEFSFTGGLHPYFAVDDSLQARVLGLQGLPVSDRYQPELTRQDEAELQFGENIVERLYAGSPALTLLSGATRLKLTASNFSEWMVWNPGREGAQALKDLPDGDWRQFICIEPVRVRQPVVLAVGEKFVGMLGVEVEERAA